MSFPAAIRTAVGSLALLALACAPAARVSVVPTAGGASGPPPIVHCFDGVPHVRGSTPFVLGGSCAHSPTAETLGWYHRDGLLKDYDLDRLKRLYADRGIKTIHDHKECNNYCPWGPHLVKGGTCMVPPTPGTKNYEEVLSGRFDRREALKQP
jgi:hypothetical protein